MHPRSFRFRKKQLLTERRAEVIYAALVQIPERLLAIIVKDSTLGRVKVISDDPKVGRTIREIDNLKVFHELAEQMRALADSYFGEAAVSAKTGYNSASQGTKSGWMRAK
jgi:hypothetical protein